MPEADREVAYYGPPPAVVVRALVTGSRDWSNPAMVEAALVTLLDRWGRDDLLVIHGNAPDGADFYAKAMCRAHGIYAASVDALWSQLRGRAGRERNEAMVHLLEPTVGLAFWDGHSAGTKDCVDRLDRHSVPVWKFPQDAATFDGSIRRPS